MNNIYQDIAERTNGDIYIGVVGPVRSGKSTFVKNFMEKLILPSIADKNERARAVDELPQSADGKTLRSRNLFRITPLSLHWTTRRRQMSV